MGSAAGAPTAAPHFAPPAVHLRPPSPSSPPTVPQYVGRELVNHSRLLHPHIVQFREVFLTDKVWEDGEG